MRTIISDETAAYYVAYETHITRSRAYFFPPGVKSYPGDVLPKHGKNKIISVSRNATYFLCKYHGLFVNSHVVIIMKSWLQFRSVL